MKGKNKAIPEPVTPRKHCPNCAYYFNDVRETHDPISKTEIDKDAGSKLEIILDKMFPGVHMSPYPGMQFRRYSSGTIYDLLGFFIPCHCEAGNLVTASYKNDEGYTNNRARLDATYHRKNQEQGSHTYSMADEL